MEGCSSSCPTQASGLRCMACASFPTPLLKLCSAHLAKHKMKKTYYWEDSLFYLPFPHWLRWTGTSVWLRFPSAAVGAIAVEEGAAAVRVWAHISFPGFLSPTVQSHFQPQALHLLTWKAAFSLREVEWAHTEHGIVLWLQRGKKTAKVMWARELEAVVFRKETGGKLLTKVSKCLENTTDAHIEETSLSFMLNGKVIRCYFVQWLLKQARPMTLLRGGCRQRWDSNY